MAKFRLLTLGELKGMEKEFVEYLILVGIAAGDWVKMKEENPEEADKLIHHFSDVVFGKIMRGTQYLEHREAKGVKALQCLKDKFVVVGLNASKIHDPSTGALEVNLLDATYLQKALSHPPAHLEVFTTEIPYELPREEEVFKMTTNGFDISDGKLFKTLCLALPE